MRIHLYSVAIAAAGVLLLAGCEYQHVQQLDRTNISGADFNANLARNYRTLADSEAAQYDWRDAKLYADRGLSATRGERVAPYDPRQRQIAAEKLPELQNAHARLTTVLAAGAPQVAPEPTANAQAQLDCWIEQQEEAFQSNDIAACRNGFLQAMAAVDAAMAGRAQPASRGLAPEPGQFLVFFAYNSAALTSDAEKVLDAAATRVRGGGTTAVQLIGYTDRSGSEGYNMRLSQLRADAVRNALIRRNVSSNLIQTEARGEREPLIQTADGVREPQNRRVSIAIRSGAPGA